MNMTQRQSSRVAGQRGITLIVALIFMVVLTLFVTAGVRSTLMQERMSGYSWEQNLAFQAAEFAAREGERIVATAVVSPTTLPTNCANGRCYKGSAPDSLDSATWADNASPAKYQVAPVAGGAWANLTPALADEPKYFFEHAGSVECAACQGGGKTELYRVTGRGVGRSDSTQVLVQSTFQP